jgi:hypothetical protein
MTAPWTVRGGRLCGEGSAVGLAGGDGGLQPALADRAGAEGAASVDIVAHPAATHPDAQASTCTSNRLYISSPLSVRQHQPFFVEDADCGARVVWDSSLVPFLPMC